MKWPSLQWASLTHAYCLVQLGHELTSYDCPCFKEEKVDTQRGKGTLAQVTGRRKRVWNEMRPYSSTA